jgi:hypothetical protein
MLFDPAFKKEYEAQSVVDILFLLSYFPREKKTSGRTLSHYACNRYARWE